MPKPKFNSSCAPLIRVCSGVPLARKKPCLICSFRQICSLFLLLPLPSQKQSKCQVWNIICTHPTHYSLVSCLCKFKCISVSPFLWTGIKLSSVTDGSLDRTKMNSPACLIHHFLLDNVCTFCYTVITGNMIAHHTTPCNIWHIAHKSYSVTSSYLYLFFFKCICLNFVYLHLFYILLHYAQGGLAGISFDCKLYSVYNCVPDK